MISGRSGREVAVLAVLCVLTIFLFPAVRGPYPVVHGPVTALQAARAALLVHIAIVQAALNGQGNSSISPQAASSAVFAASTEWKATGSPEHNPTLRC